jgi:hypothetical protein
MYVFLQNTVPAFQLHGISICMRRNMKVIHLMTNRMYAIELDKGTHEKMINSDKTLGKVMGP